MPESTFEGAFASVRVVRLAEPDTAPLTGIRRFAPTPDGRFLVVDEGRPQVRVFGREGELERIVGRHGDGPGEFRRPAAARMDAAGRLAVVDSDASLTLFDTELTFDTVFRIPALSAFDLDFIRNDLFAVVWNELSEPYDFLVAVLGRDGALKHSLHPVDTLIWSVPYWVSFAGPVGAAGSERIVTANMFFYPLHLYDGEGRHIRDFGEPPASWRPAGKPERGEFIGLAGQDRLQAWLRAMTFIRRLGIYRDSAIIVTHAIRNPGPADFYAFRDTLLDVYSIEGEKLLEDVPVPGRVLEAKDYLYVLEAEPPEGWVVGVYRLRTESLDF